MAAKKIVENAHRKAWIEHYCRIPNGWHIHHIDGNPSNNNILNLECVTPRQHGGRHRATALATDALVNLQAIRESLGMSREELCVKANIGHSSVCAYECQRRKPKPSTAKRLATALGVSVQELW